MTGTHENEILVGGQGFDVIDGGPGDDVIIAGEGHDTIFYDPATDTRRVDGGSGIDTLKISGAGIHLDLPTLNQTEYYQLFENIERIDLTGSGDNTLSILPADLLHLSSTTNTLWVEGNAGDKIISNPDFGTWTYLGIVDIDQTYHLFQFDNAFIYVHQDIDRSEFLESEFEIFTSDLLPANGGDGSKGFVINGIAEGDFFWSLREFCW